MLLLKLVLVPALVAGVTLAARRWGLRVGGLLTALPMVAGPTLCFYAIEQGNAFAASAARTALLGIVATAACGVAYARSATRVGWPVSVGLGWLAFVLVAALMYLVRIVSVAELALTVVSLLIAQQLLPSPAFVLAPSRPPAWDLPLRMVAAALLVVVLTSVASRLGPRVSGLFAAFPIATIVIAAFTHAQRGHEAVAWYCRGLLRGLHSFALFCFVFGLALGPMRLALVPAVTMALAAQLLLQTAILWWMSRQPAGAAQTACT